MLSMLLPTFIFHKFVFYLRFLLKFHKYFSLRIDFAQQLCRSYLLNILPKRHTKGLSQGKERRYKEEIWVSSILHACSNPALKFCSVFVFYIPMYCLGQHFVLSLLYLVVKTQQYFVTSSCMFLDEKTMLIMWLNPGG